MKTAEEKEEFILRPRMAKWLKVGESDVFRWVFWKEFGRRTPSKSEIARLKERMMDADWPLIDKARNEGRLYRWRLGDLWFRLKCRLASEVGDLDLWILRRNSQNMFNGIVDVERDKRYARERLEVLKNRERNGGLLMYELEDAARCYEELGDQAAADRVYRKILDIKLQGTKWPEPPA